MAAVAIAPANLNWVSLALLEDNTEDWWVPTREFTGIGSSIWESPDEYLEGSPVFRLRQVETPLLLAIGDLDHHSFTLPTIQIYLGLRSLGKPVTLLRYPGFGHGFYGPAGDDLYARVRAFVDQHIGGDDIRDS